MPNKIQIRSSEQETNLNGIIFPIDNLEYIGNAKQSGILVVKDFILSDYTYASGGTSGTSGKDGLLGMDGTSGTSGTSGVSPTELDSNHIRIKNYTSCNLDGIIDCEFGNCDINGIIDCYFVEPTTTTTTDPNCYLDGIIDCYFEIPTTQPPTTTTTTTFVEYSGAGASITKGLWHLNGSNIDSSGNNNTATDTNVTYIDGGLIGKCASFNGTSSRIIGNSSSTLAVNSITISLWIKTSVMQVYNTYICNNMKSYNMGNIGISFSGNTIRLGIYQDRDGDGYYIYYSNVDASVPNYYNNNWHNIIATYSNGLLSLYYDGTLMGSKNEYTFPVGNIMNIGTNANVFTYNGLIDEVIVENYAWTSTQVNDYYHLYL